MSKTGWCFSAVAVLISVSMAIWSALEMVKTWGPTDSILFKVVSLFSFPLLFLCWGAWAVIRSWEISDKERNA